MCTHRCMCRSQFRMVRHRGHALESRVVSCVCACDGGRPCAHRCIGSHGLAWVTHMRVVRWHSHISDFTTVWHVRRWVHGCTLVYGAVMHGVAYRAPGEGVP